MILTSRFWLQEERLWRRLSTLDPNLAERIERDAGTGCWLWKGASVSSNGRAVRYGTAQRPLGHRWRRRNTLTHRWTYILLIDDIPDGFEMHHWCDVTICCNPLHCEPIEPEEHLALEQELALAGYAFQPPPKPDEERMADPFESDLPF